tara:strand:+ start:1783 stop:2589 length:807 start_codon:yes stop_codon:yes gene_type:complete
LDIKQFLPKDYVIFRAQDDEPYVLEAVLDEYLELARRSSSQKIKIFGDLQDPKTDEPLYIVGADDDPESMLQDFLDVLESDDGKEKYIFFEEEEFDPNELHNDVEWAKHHLLGGDTNNAPQILAALYVLVNVEYITLRQEILWEDSIDDEITQEDLFTDPLDVRSALQQIGFEGSVTDEDYQDKSVIGQAKNLVNRYLNAMRLSMTSEEMYSAVPSFLQQDARRFLEENGLFETLVLAPTENRAVQTMVQKHHGFTRRPPKPDPNSLK